MRASDHRRELAVAALRQQAVDGCLSLDTFAARIEEAYGATTVEELDRLLADLPVRRRRLGAFKSGVKRVLGGIGKRPVAGPPSLEIEVRLPRSVDAVTVGRSSDCDVVVGEPSVSRYHAELRHNRGEDWIVRDLDSTNGTWLNGARVREARVFRGDVLSLGGLRMELRL